MIEMSIAALTFLQSVFKCVGKKRAAWCIYPSCILIMNQLHWCNVRFLLLPMHLLHSGSQWFARAYPSCFRVRAGSHLGQVTCASQGRTVARCSLDYWRGRCTVSHIAHRVAFVTSDCVDFLFSQVCLCVEPNFSQFEKKLWPPQSPPHLPLASNDWTTRPKNVNVSFGNLISKYPVSTLGLT